MANTFQLYKSGHLVPSFLRVVFVLFPLLSILHQCRPAHCKPKTAELDAKKYMEELEFRYSQECNKKMLEQWNYETNLTDENSQIAADAATKFSMFQAEIQKEVLEKFPDWRKFLDSNIRRQIRFLLIQGTGNMTMNDVEKMNLLLNEMQGSYSTGTVCNYTDSTKCEVPLEPDIEDILRDSSDYDELKHYWNAWHDKMSELVPASKYAEYVSYLHKNAVANGFRRLSDLFYAYYDDGTNVWSSDQFKRDMWQAWMKIRPFYHKIHAYIRMKLKAVPEYAPHFDKDCGYIPAHLLGNMWAESWSALDNLTKPFPHESSVDATQAMIDQNYTPIKIFQLAERFFVKIGLPPLSKTFWEKSVLEKPTDREVQCHASAEDMCLGKGNDDFRVKQCTKVSQEYLIVTHHELGHIQYYMHYTNLSYVFRTGANEGFHEAIGDALGLAVVTPKHLECVLGLNLGLSIECNSSAYDKIAPPPPPSPTDINFLYLSALEHFPAFPFTLALDKWRWEVFDGITPEAKFNIRWWELREELQGITPPGNRSTSKYFDAASKLHVLANVDCIRYFISYILKYQFFEALCIAAGEYNPSAWNTKPLYQCDFYGSKPAGKLLGDMMRLGASKAWPDVLEVITGSRKMSINPLLNYYRPLFAHIDIELRKNKVTTGYGKC